tara:strand:- start:1248 stop:1445 length:198 start_codon:yes stop_codon:yes gene_type:complete
MSRTWHINPNDAPEGYVAEEQFYHGQGGCQGCSFIGERNKHGCLDRMCLDMDREDQTNVIFIEEN